MAFLYIIFNGNGDACINMSNINVKCTENTVFFCYEWLANRECTHIMYKLSCSTRVPPYKI